MNDLPPHYAMKNFSLLHYSMGDSPSDVLEIYLANSQDRDGSMLQTEISQVLAAMDDHRLAEFMAELGGYKVERYFDYRQYLEETLRQISLLQQ